MRAIVLRKPGAPEHLTLEEVEDPTPAAAPAPMPRASSAGSYWARTARGR